jgi:hypothetical protein
MRHLCAVIVAGALALAVSACSDSPASPSDTSTGTSTGGSTSPTIPANNGRLLVRFGASPLPQGKAVLMTLSRIRIYRGSPTDFSDVTLSGGQITCDLNKLTSEAEIAASAVPGAAYSQVGLVVQSATVYVDNESAGSPCATSISAPGGRSAALSVPAGEIALPRNFDVRTGVDTVMRLNFNTEQAIRLTGTNTFSFTPMFSVLSVS